MMIDRDAEDKPVDAKAETDQTRALIAQIASIANSAMLLTVLVMGGFVAYVIGDIRNDLQDLTKQVRGSVPTLDEKELVIKALREESAQLKARVEQLQKDASRQNDATNDRDKKGDRLGAAGADLADCINAVLNNKGSPDEKCAGKGRRPLVIRSQG